MQYSDSCQMIYSVQTSLHSGAIMSPYNRCGKRFLRCSYIHARISNLGFRPHHLQMMDSTSQYHMQVRVSTPDSIQCTCTRVSSSMWFVVIRLQYIDNDQGTPHAHITSVHLSKSWLPSHLDNNIHVNTRPLGHCILRPFACRIEI